MEKYTTYVENENLNIRRKQACKSIRTCTEPLQTTAAGHSSHSVVVLLLNSVPAIGLGARASSTRTVNPLMIYAYELVV